MVTPTNEAVGHLQDYHSARARLRVLILEDNQRDAELFIQKLKEAGFALEADTVDTEDAFVASFRSGFTISSSPTTPFPNGAAWKPSAS